MVSSDTFGHGAYMFQISGTVHLNCCIIDLVNPGTATVVEIQEYPRSQLDDQPEPQAETQPVEGKPAWGNHLDKQ